MWTYQVQKKCFIQLGTFKLTLDVDVSVDGHLFLY